MGRLQDIGVGAGAVASEAEADLDATGTDIRFPEGTEESAVQLDADGDPMVMDDEEASTTRPAPIEVRGPKLAQVPKQEGPRGKRLAVSSQRMEAVPQPTDDIQISGGVDNVFDREYERHLAGYNRVSGSDVAIGDRLPGVGRNFYVRFSFSR